MDLRVGLGTVDKRNILPLLKIKFQLLYRPSHPDLSAVLITLIIVGIVNLTVCKLLSWPVTVDGGLRHVLSLLVRKPGSWVRMTHKAWMFGMCLICVCVVLCLGRGLATS
jgi:hypothetical protein